MLLRCRRNLMILGIGVDIVHLPRIAAIVQRGAGHKFARRILSVPEFKHWNQIEGTDTQRKTRFLAVRWAVKEAAYKALYPTVKGTWRNFTYLSLAPSGKKPSLTYASPTKQLEKIGPIHVSVSHDGKYTVAYVVAERTDNQLP